MIELLFFLEIYEPNVFQNGRSGLTKHQDAGRTTTVSSDSCTYATSAEH